MKELLDESLAPGHQEASYLINGGRYLGVQFVEQRLVVLQSDRLKCGAGGNRFFRRRARASASAGASAQHTSLYKSANFDATSLDPASIEGAISIDVIWAIPDQRAGFAETARILKPGARFVFTDWERDLSHLVILHL
jgi:hypothetical protein